MTNEEPNNKIETHANGNKEMQLIHTQTIFALRVPNSVAIFVLFNDSYAGTNQR